MDGMFTLSTPCYIYDELGLRENLRGFRMAMEGCWDKGPVSMGISVKTAPIAGVLELARSEGYCAEVVSDDEYALALDAGFRPDEVVFNGPIKSKEWMFFALDSGAVVNIDSNRELRYAEEYARECCMAPRVGLRVNFDLESACPGETCAGGEPARFGFCVEDGLFAGAVARLRSAGIEPAGLHLHTSTSSHSTSVYEELCREAVRLVSSCSLIGLEYVDVGGGFYGGGADQDSYLKYAHVIAEGLAPLGDIKVILEPGGSVLATAGSLLGRVIDSKTVRGTRFVVTELSKLDLNSTLFSRRSFSCEPVIDCPDRERLCRQTICGYTCMEMDRVVDVDDWPALEEGDLVLIHNAGAYAASFAPGFFIKQMPSVYLKLRDGTFRPLEERGRRLPPRAPELSF